MSGRSLLRDAAVKFDPLLLYINKASNQHSGWYTCIVANTQGRNEATTYIKVMPNKGNNMQMNIRRVDHNRQQKPRQPAPLIRKPTEFVENVQWMEFDPEQERREIEAERRQQQQRRRLQEESVNAGRLEGAMKQQHASGGSPVYSR